MIKKPHPDPPIAHEDLDAVTSQEEAGLSDEPALSGHFATENDNVEQSIWDEPAYLVSGLPVPEHALTYDAWFRARQGMTSAAASWAVTGVLFLFGGIFAVFGALWQGVNMPPLIALVLVGPLAEEMLKISPALILLEDKPYLFRSQLQVLLAAVGTALGFAIIENLMYIYLYHPQGGFEYRVWRWTVCTGLHVGATSIAALGLLRMRRESIAEAPKRYCKPRINAASGYLIAATVLHGVYNFFALFISVWFEPF